MINTLQKMGIEGTYLNRVKAIYDKPNSKHYSQWWKTESIPSKIRNKTRVSTVTTINQPSSGSPSYSNQRRKRNKRNPDQKRRSKALTVCRWCDTVHATAKSLQSCLTLCDPIDSSPPGSPVPGTLQARTLEWVAVSFSSSWKWKVKVKSLSRVQLLVTPWTAAYQAHPSMGFSRQEYWSGVPLPSLNTVHRKL